MEKAGIGNWWERGKGLETGSALCWSTDRALGEREVLKEAM